MVSTATPPRINGTTPAPQPAPAPAPAAGPEGPTLLDRAIAATRHSLADVKTMATEAARSQMFGLTEPQAFTLMMISEAEGLHPIRALQRYHVIEGRPAMRADAMQAEFQRRGGRLRWLETTADRCRLEAWHPKHHPEHLTFDVALKDLFDRGLATTWNRDRKQAEVKSVYRRFPAQMLRARAISEAVRAIDPGVVVGMYTPEEVGDFSPSSVVSSHSSVVGGQWSGGSTPDNPRADEARAAQQRTTDDGRRTKEPKPAPRPRPAPAPPGPDPEPEPDPDPEPDPEPDDVSATMSPLRRYVRRAIAVAEEELTGALAAAGRPLPTRAELCNEHQVINGVVRDWIETGLLDEGDVAGDDGRRDRDRVARVVTGAWRRDRDGLREDVEHYLRGKLDAARRDHGIGIAPAGDRDEDQAMADDDGAGGGE